MKKTLALFIAVFIMVLAAGCTGNKDAATNDSPAGQQPGKQATVKLIEPEALISQEEAAAILGQPVHNGEKKETKAVGLKLCIYTGKKDAKFLQIGLTQQAFMPANGQSPQAIYTSLKNNLPTPISVEGIGDEAFIAPPGLHILKNGYYITLAVGNSADAKNQALLKSTGNTAVENLEKLLRK